MFNPNQIANLRAAIEAEGTIARFEGHTCQTLPILLEPSLPVETYASQPRESIAFHGPARIFGSPCDPACMADIIDCVLDAPVPMLYCVENARIIGNQALIDRDSRLYRPDPVRSGTDTRWLLDQNALGHDGFLLLNNDGILNATFASREETRRFDHSVVFLHNLEPGNYGSFIFRLLPQLLFIAASGMDFSAYVTPERTPWFFDALRLLGFPRRPIFTVPEICGDFFRRVYVSTELSSEGLFSQATRRGFIDLARRAATAWPSDPTSRKLYVSRSLAASARPWYRVLRNELALEAIARRSGFTVVHPETLSFPEQVAAFGTAHRIVGPSGSGMLNAVFAEHGTRVLDMESFTTNVRQHAKIYDSTRKTYSFLFGELAADDQSHPITRRWSVPEAHFRDGIDWLDG